MPKFTIIKLPCVLLILALLQIKYVNAQGEKKEIPMIGTIKGKVVESDTKKPVEFATITIKNALDKSFISGTVSDEKGNYTVENLPLGKNYIIIAFIGYKPYKDSFILKPSQPTLVLQTVNLSISGKELKEVVVEGKKAEFALEIDKKVFNVDKNPIVQGGSALDALKQVPSVTVDIDNKISLRGSENVLILVNGKPSGMKGNVMDQIPASSIESIELITNPSAKYDAEGMSGIINIITKKNLSAMSNGSVSLGVGSHEKYNGAISYNYKKDKFSINNNLGFRYNPIWINGFNNRDNYIPTQPVFSINTQLWKEKVNLNGTYTGGIDYQFSSKTNLTTNYTVSYGGGKSPERTRYEFLDSNRNYTQIFYRDNTDDEENLTTDAGFTLTHQFIPTMEELSFGGNYSLNDAKNYSHFTQQNYAFNEVPDGSLPYLQNIIRKNRFDVNTFQLDYYKKFENESKFEVGLKNTYRISDNIIDADSFSYLSMSSIKDSIISNTFSYFDIIPASYVNYSGKLKDWGYQAGVRYELTFQKGTQEIGNKSFTNNYDNLFPSAYLSRKFKGNLDAQIGYTRRINRPNGEILNPFAEYSDPYNIRTGNPNIKPELIDAYEGTVTKYIKGQMFSSTVYFRKTNDAHQRVRQIMNDGRSVVTFQNIDYKQSLGYELITRNRLTSWWNLVGNINIYKQFVSATIENRDVDVSNFTYSGRIMSNMNFKNTPFKWLNNTDFQISSMFMGPQVFPQGRMKEMWGIDLGLKKDIIPNKAFITLNLTDLLDTRRFNILMGDPFFKGELLRKRETQIFTVNFTYKFGKDDSSPSKPKKGRGDGEPGGGGDMGM